MSLEFFVHYKLGIKKIDLEHLTIVDLIEKIGKTSEKGDWELGKIYIKELKNLQNTHFSDEELMMHEIGFPYIEYHKIEHSKIIDQFDEFMLNFGTNGLGFTSSKLEKLVLDHIDNLDSQYVNHYNKWLALQE